MLRCMKPDLYANGILTVIAILMMVAGSRETTANAQGPGPGATTKGSANTKETYRDLKKEDGIQFDSRGVVSLSGPSGKSYIIAGFGLVDSGGKFIELELIDHENITDVIKTKRFGNIILKSMNPEVYAATETQIKQIHEFLSAQARKSTTPSK